MFLLLTIEKSQVLLETELSKPLATIMVLVSLAILNTSQLQTDILLSNAITLFPGVQIIIETIDFNGCEGTIKGYKATFGTQKSISVGQHNGL